VSGIASGRYLLYAGRGVLSVPLARTTLMQALAFCVDIPSVSNGLPLEWRLVSMKLSDTFYRRLKTSSSILLGHFQSLPLLDLDFESNWLAKCIWPQYIDVKYSADPFPPFFHVTCRPKFSIFVKMRCINTIIPWLLVFELPTLLFNLNRNDVAVYRPIVLKTSPEQSLSFDAHSSFC